MELWAWFWEVHDHSFSHFYYKGWLHNLLYQPSIVVSRLNNTAKRESHSAVVRVLLYFGSQTGSIDCTRVIILPPGFLAALQLTEHHLSCFAFQFFFACFPAHHNIIMFLFLPARGRYFLLLRQQLHCTTLMNPHKGKICLWCLFLPWQPKCSSSFLYDKCCSKMHPTPMLSKHSPKWGFIS